MVPHDMDPVVWTIRYGLYQKNSSISCSRKLNKVLPGRWDRIHFCFWLVLKLLLNLLQQCCIWLLHFRTGHNSLSNHLSSLCNCSRLYTPLKISVKPVLLEIEITWVFLVIASNTKRRNTIHVVEAIFWACYWTTTISLTCIHSIRMILSAEKRFVCIPISTTIYLNWANNIKLGCFGVLKRKNCLYLINMSTLNEILSLSLLSNFKILTLRDDRRYFWRCVQYWRLYSGKVKD